MRKEILQEVGTPAFADIFAAALAQGRPPAGIGKRGGRPDAGRFRVYRNNVGVALAGALAKRFPVVRQLVGDAFFAAMAQTYVALERPSSPVMSHYGDGFPAFVETYPPAAALAYLADVARLEVAVSQAYHAAEAEVADLATLGAVPPERLEGISLRPHPAVRLLISRHPVGTIWSAHQSDCVRPVENWIGETILVTRPHADIRLTILPPADASFVAAILQGRPVGAAAAGDHRIEEIGRALIALFQFGAIEGLSIPEGSA